jgi:homoserine dehydrogenase
MWEDNMTQQEALSRAQEKGYAEADPSKDIMGLDALYKIFILASLGFRAQINLNQISYSGINEITLEDVQLVKQLAYRVKLLATARRKESKVDIRINPVLIEDGQLLAHIHGADNGIFLSGYGYGNLFFSGAGAGGIAGASMIVSDIVKIIRQPHYFEYGFLLKDFQELNIQRFDQLENQYFLKVKLENGEKNKENIQNILSKNNLLIKKTAEIRNEDGDNSLTMGIITDLVQESEFKRICSEIKELSYTRAMNYLEVYRNA